MKPEEIEIGASYLGGKKGESRTVLGWGYSRDHLLWAPTRERLPYGGFAKSQGCETKTFAKWATGLDVAEEDRATAETVAMIVTAYRRGLGCTLKDTQVRRLLRAPERLAAALAQPEGIT